MSSSRVQWLQVSPVPPRTIPNSQQGWRDGCSRFREGVPISTRLEPIQVSFRSQGTAWAAQALSIMAGPNDHLMHANDLLKSTHARRTGKRLDEYTELSRHQPTTAPWARRSTSQLNVLLFLLKSQLSRCELRECSTRALPRVSKTAQRARSSGQSSRRRSVADTEP